MIPFEGSSFYPYTFLCLVDPFDDDDNNDNDNDNNDDNDDDDDDDDDDDTCPSGGEPLRLLH